MSTPCRILMPTDVPFWRRRDGAQQRIAALVDYFAASPFVLQVFYLGPWSESDSAATLEQPWTIIRFDSNDPPTRWLAKVRWYWQATWNQWDRTRQRRSAQGDSNAAVTDGGHSSDSKPEIRHSLTLDDYRWPFAGDKFLETVESFRPQVILCQYITMSYLLESLPQSVRQKTLCAVDTHDVLHRRQAQFLGAGLPHWLDIDLTQEVAAWNQFDLILAIQAEEARFIETHVDTSRVLVVGHDVPIATPTKMSNAIESSSTAKHAAPQDNINQATVLGYIASANDSNRESIDWLLGECWPNVVGNRPGIYELLIAGGICQHFDEHWRHRLNDRLCSTIRCLGVVEDVRTFYRQLDATLNPVRLGTGLKIKNVESLAYGVPVITTPEGAIGMLEEQVSAGCQVVDRGGFAKKLQDLQRAQLAIFRQRLQQFLAEASNGSPYDQLANRFLGTSS